MQRYLLFDSGCTSCKNIADKVEEISEGWLQSRSLRHPWTQEMLAKSGTEWSWEPMLLEVSDSSISVTAGVRMRLRLLRALGPRRSWQLAHEVSRTQRQAAGMTRQGFLKYSLATAAVITGLSAASSPLASAGGTKPALINGSREGVKSYGSETVMDASGATIPFTHSTRSRSGTLVSRGLDTPRVSFDLERDGAVVLQIEVDRTAGTCVIQDRSGQQATLNLAEHRREPGADPIIDGSYGDIVLASAIQADLEFTMLSSAAKQLVDESRAGEQAAGACLCNYSSIVRGVGAGSSRSAACTKAREDALYACWNCACAGCCEYLSCDCWCGVGDYLCQCGITGYRCQECLPSC